ncbi:site-specific DNA-methyltransferase [Helicobacter sp.]|uniref:site-specific DNA-methyltransferase n=1 Tax=Helicobacter sp. TaxID=218 RepID=UPI002A759704|nr:site-specific DNA-methyltransferase [Helicobacter sp.]MDY2584328.1 site-specific DNA-methyltransferase [Helicobacter sp.]
MVHLQWRGKKAVQNHYSYIPYHTLDLLYTYPSTSQASKLDSSIAREALGLAKNCAKTSLDGYPTSNFKDSQEICHENLAENKIIKGDNLLALKSLLPMYANKIHCIYIDPPYNTGSENWIYNDNVNSPLMQKWLSKVVNREDLTRHDKWLCMMYPRLRLLHELLSESGVIFISIDDNEMAHLKLLCDEIFGERNFVDTLHWKRKKQPSFLAKHTAKVMEYVLVYAKHKESLNKLSLDTLSDATKKVINLTNQLSVRKFSKGVRVKLGEKGVIKKGVYKIKTMSVEYLNDVFYENGITTNEVEVRALFSVSQEKIDDFIKHSLLFITTNYGLRRDVSEEEKQGRKSITDLLLKDWGDNQESEKELLAIFGKKIFDYPKPRQLIQNLIQCATYTKKDSIILDSFAGSGTTAHAVLELNKQDGGNRKFILIECEDYADSITAQRVKYAISGYGKEPMLNATGGEFSFLEVGEPVLLNKKGKKVLNENLKIQKILEYIFYTEFNTALTYDKDAFSANYFVGEVSQKALYFIYEKHKSTTLNLEFLPRLKKQDSYIIYADNCTLSQAQLNEQNIEFRQIPRDIRKL